MKKRILSFFVTFCMILPLMGTATVWAADVKMPETDSVLILDSGDMVTSLVLNDQDELWMYNLSRKWNDQKQMTIYTYDAKSARCLLTGVEAISGGSRSLYALKHDGSLVNFFVADGKAVQKGTIMTGVEAIGNLTIYFSLALDKNGNLYTLEGGWAPSDYKDDALWDTVLQEQRKYMVTCPER